MKVMFFISLLAFIFHDLPNRILNFKGGVKLRINSSKSLKRNLHPDFKSLFERRLYDRENKIPEKSFVIKHDEEYKKTKFMKIVASILKEAKAKNLKIKSIKLGKKIRSIFDNPHISEVLIDMVNDPKFFNKFKKELKMEKSHKKKKHLLRMIKKKQRKLLFY